MNLSLFDGTAVLLHDMHLKRDQDLHRHKVEVVYKEAELQKLHNFLPISSYRAIRDPVKMLLGLPAQSTAPSIKPGNRGRSGGGGPMMA